MTPLRRRNARAPRPYSSLRIVVATVALALFMALILALAFDVRNQLRRLDTASTDAVLWTLVQTEIEANRLETITLRLVADPDEDLRALRIRFDILFSRAGILRTSPSYSVLQDAPETRQAFSQLDSFFKEWIPIVDGPDAELLRQLPALAEDAARLRETTRSLSLAGISGSAEQSANQRDSVSQTLTRIALLTLVLVAVLLVVLVILVRLVRVREAQSLRNKEMRQRMETIIATSLDAVIVTNIEGKVIDFNGAAEKMFGYARADALGADMARLILPDYLRIKHGATISDYIAQTAARENDRDARPLEAKRSDGSLFPIDVSLSNALTPQGEILVAFIRDITDQVQAETDLRGARDRAIAGEKSKAQLLAVMSHEMRTPLNGILGTLELFDPNAFAKSDARYLKIIRNSAVLLLDQVNNVLDISRIDADKMHIKKRPFDLIALLQEIIDGQAGSAAANGNRLILRPPDPSLHEVFSDPERLRQVLLNLLSNAIKFTENGKITIEVDCTEGLGSVEIRVTDSGIGIAEEDLDKIFGDFVTLDTSYQRRSMGTGLGLGISQRLVKALGGELGAESEPGDGSLFWLRLPLAPPPSQPAMALEDQLGKGGIARAPAPPMTTLIVEDNAVNRLILRKFLERDGHTVTEARDGQEGVDKAMAQEFDVILMDISMPGMDGLCASRLIRKGNCPNSKTPIIATTAHALPDELRAFCDAGMCQTLVKPISRTSLRNVLAQARDGVQTMPPGANGAGAAEQNEPLFDPAQLRDIQRDLSPEQVSQNLNQFSDEMTAFLATNLKAFAPSTLPSTAQEAHRLAGSAGVFGALRLARYLQAAELSAKHEELAATKDALSRAQVCWAETQAAIAAEHPPQA